MNRYSGLAWLMVTFSVMTAVGCGGASRSTDLASSVAATRPSSAEIAARAQARKLQEASLAVMRQTCGTFDVATLAAQAHVKTHEPLVVAERLARRTAPGVSHKQREQLVDACLEGMAKHP